MLFGRMAAGLPEYSRSVSTLVSMPTGFLDRSGDTLTLEDGLFIQSQSKARHFTYIFNIFVSLQLFNMINCRKIGKRDFNIFENIFHNWYFIVLFAIIPAVQFIGIQYFSFIFRTVPLNRTEWGSCIAIGSTVLIWGAILKLLPESWFSRLNTSKLINEDEVNESKFVKMVAEKKKVVSEDPGTEEEEQQNMGDDDDHFDRA